MAKERISSAELTQRKEEYYGERGCRESRALSLLLTDRTDELRRFRVYVSHSYCRTAGH